MGKVVVLVIVSFAFLSEIQTTTVHDLNVTGIPVVIEEQNEESIVRKTIPEFNPEVGPNVPDSVPLKPCAACFDCMTPVKELVEDDSVVQSSHSKPTSVINLPEDEDDEILEEEEVVPEDEAVLDDEVVEEETLEEEEEEEEIPEEETEEEEIVEEEEDDEEETSEKETPEETAQEEKAETVISKTETLRAEQEEPR